MPPEENNQLDYPLDKTTQSIIKGLIDTINSNVNDKGVVELSTAPVDQFRPIAVGTNDIRIPNFATDGEASDTYAVTLSPVPTSYFTGMVVRFSANTANTGAATLNVNSLGAKTIKRNHDQDLITNDIEAGQIVTVVYDGTNFQMESQLGNSGVQQAKTEVFTSNGTWTRPSGVTSVIVECIGAGGGGGESDAGAGADQAGGGGGGGGYAMAEVAVSGNVTVTVGPGGAGGTGGGASSNDGSAGGNSSFAGDVTVTGNGGSGGKAGDNGTPNGSGGQGGTSSNADLSVPGKIGGTRTSTTSGEGGDSHMGFGGRLVTNGIGTAGTNYGGGGSGGNKSGADGGAGAGGVVIVTWIE